MVYALAAIVQVCVQNRGDARIPLTGFAIQQSNVILLIKAHAPGTDLDITYSTAAAIIRGMWDMSASFGYSTFSANVYIGMLSPQYLRGSIRLIGNFGSENGTNEATELDLSSVLDVA